MDILEYKIPPEIKDRIPEYFYYALGGEYVSVSSKGALIRDEDGLSLLEYNSSTCRYVEAFKMTCKKLDMNWLFEYYNSLSWAHSDIFDGEIASEVIKRFEENKNPNPYYTYLIGGD